MHKEQDSWRMTMDEIHLSTYNRYQCLSEWGNSETFAACLVSSITGTQNTGKPTTVSAVCSNSRKNNSDSIFLFHSVMQITCAADRYTITENTHRMHINRIAGHFNNTKIIAHSPANVRQLSCQNTANGYDVFCQKINACSFEEIHHTCDFFSK